MYETGPANASIGYASNKLGAEPQQAELQELAMRLEQSVKTATVTCEVLMSLRDRLFGARPETPQPGINAPRPVRSGLVGALHDRSDDLNATLNRLQVLVSQVERVA